MVQPPPPAADRSRRFLILPFRNVTKQPDQDWLVEGSTTMLVEALGRWKGISVVPDEKLYPALKRAGIAPGSIADAALVRRVSEETGGWTAVTGEVLATGGKIRVTARAWDVPTSKELVRASSEIASGGDVRAAFDSVSLRLLRSAGFDSVSVSLATATTHNLDAYRSYLSGLAHERRSEAKPALKDFQDAVRLDSTFATAWSQLAQMTLSVEPGAILNPQSNAAQYSRRAVALSAKLPARDRQLVLANDAMFQAQFGDARHILEALVAADSNDFDATAALIGVEMFDPILVNVPGGQRPRQSANRAARLAKRTAELDPSRHQMLGLLASIYAGAGVPGATPAIGVDRAPSSFPDLMQSLRQREHIRIYVPLLGDSLILVPAESLAAIPKDSIRAMRKRARASAKQWADRWMAVASDESAPFALAAELHSYDHEYPEALAALAKAESLGVQNPAWSAPARRSVFLAKAGNLAASTRLADSLTAAGFFANPNNMLSSADAGMWAFALDLIAGHLPRAGALMEQEIALRRLLGAPNVEYNAFVQIMGNEDPEEEPGISRAIRAMELDSLVAHLKEAIASPQLGPLTPLLLPMLAEVSDTTKQRTAGLLKVADGIANGGKPQLAFQIANNAVQSDSTLEGEAAKFSWYRTGAEARNTAASATQQRFRVGSATIAADRAVFEWTVADTGSFPINRAETPIGQGEYKWEVTMDLGGRYYRLVQALPTKMPGAAPASMPLADLIGLPNAQRLLSTGTLMSNGVLKDTTMMQSVSFRAEVAPGVMRMVLTDRNLIDELRRVRPAEARFKIGPCIRPVGSTAKAECVEGTARIVYP